MDELLEQHDRDPSLANFLRLARECTARHIHSADKTIQLACVYNHARAYCRAKCLPRYFAELGLHFTKSGGDLELPYLIYHANEAKL